MNKQCCPQRFHARLRRRLLRVTVLIAALVAGSGPSLAAYEIEREGLSTFLRWYLSPDRQNQAPGGFDPGSLLAELFGGNFAAPPRPPLSPEPTPPTSEPPSEPIPEPTPDPTLEPTAPPAPGAIQFEDVSATAGLDLSIETYGASFGDFNSDGRLDIVTSNHRRLGSLYINRGDGRFRDLGSQVKRWIFKPRADTHGASFADFDNDGDQDLVLATGTGNPNQFLVNEYGELIDRSAEMGVTLVGRASRMPLWFDFNRDMRMDLLFANHRGAAPLMVQSEGRFVNAAPTYGIACSEFHYAQFFDATGDGLPELLCSSPEGGAMENSSNPFPQNAYNMQSTPFEDVTFTSGLPQTDQVVDSATADFDGDLRDDIFNLRGILRPSGVAQRDTTVEAQLMSAQKGMRFVTRGTLEVWIYWNLEDELEGVPNVRIGAGNFNPAAKVFTLDPTDPRVVGQPSYTPEEAPVITIGYEPTTSEWQFVSDAGGTFSNAYMIVRSNDAISELRTIGLWRADEPMSPTLLLHTDGGYVDNTATAGLSDPISCISAVAGDMDNDMDVDLYLACRTGPANVANLLFSNRGDGTFEKIENAGGAEGPVGLAITHGAGTADTAIIGDWDNDGALDLFVTNGFNMRPLDFGGPHKLYRNTTASGNHWIELELEATSSARSAMGARVFAEAAGVTQVRSQNGGYHRVAQDSTRIHFGLAQATTVDLRIEWPSGVVEVFPGVAADQIYRATEGRPLEVLVPNEGQLLPCGDPEMDNQTDAGVMLWKDCVTQTWKVRALSAGTNTLYSGSLWATANLTGVNTMGLEPDDQVDAVSDPARLTFGLNVSSNATDGFSFVLEPGATACLELASDPADRPVYFGPLRRVITPPFDLRTGAPCAP